MAYLAKFGKACNVKTLAYLHTVGKHSSLFTHVTKSEKVIVYNVSP
jgi:hypothetical protein